MLPGMGEKRRWWFNHRLIMASRSASCTKSNGQSLTRKFSNTKITILVRHSRFYISLYKYNNSTVREQNSWKCSVVAYTRKKASGISHGAWARRRRVDWVTWVNISGPAGPERVDDAGDDPKHLTFNSRPTGRECARWRRPPVVSLCLVGYLYTVLKLGLAIFIKLRLSLWQTTFHSYII